MACRPALPFPFLLPLLVALLASAACSAIADDGAQTLARLRELAGQGRCGDSAQCHTVAIGAKACGGPEAYLPWSGADPAVAPQVSALAAQYTAARRAANQAAPAMASDCRLIPDPGAMCVLPAAAPAAAHAASAGSASASEPAADPAGAGTCVLRPSGMRDPT
jgi:hypothetical protein